MNILNFKFGKHKIPTGNQSANSQIESDMKMLEETSMNPKLSEVITDKSFIGKSYAKPDFGGETYEPEFDEARLKGQMKRVYELMSDGRWLRLHHIATVCSCTESSASARLRDFRKVRFGSHTVNRKRDEIVPGLFWYQLVLNPKWVKK